MTVSELTERLTLREFYDWESFSLLEPFVSERVDIAGAIVSSTLANVNRGKSQKAFSMMDFMVVANSLKREVSEQDTSAAEDLHFTATMMALGGVPS